VALVVAAKRDVLLRVHRHRLRPADLEECFAQAALELVLAARRGDPFASRLHAANCLEQRFLSRVRDRRRALSGRSPIQAALEEAASFSIGDESLAPCDRRSDPERVALAREQLEMLRASVEQLSEDQRLVLASQVALGIQCERFCEMHGWSREKYRKVAQRGRARLRRLIASRECPTPALASDQQTGTRL